MKNTWYMWIQRYVWEQLKNKTWLPFLLNNCICMLLFCFEIHILVLPSRVISIFFFLFQSSITLTLFIKNICQVIHKMGTGSIVFNFFIALSNFYIFVLLSCDIHFEIASRKAVASCTSHTPLALKQEQRQQLIWTNKCCLVILRNVIITAMNSLF